ncbi:MAG: LysR family transcriptional regulator [Pigmentiphaga sp.]|nr:LysR family transcriptional regulator [Pigmentiphaga sp.]
MKGLDDLFLFQQVVEHGGLSAAARALGLPKSTLARRLKALEVQLRSPLFHRSPRRFVLTNFGRECYQQAIRVSREAEKIFQMADRMADTPSGSLHVAWPPMLGELALERIALDFMAAAPNVTLHIEESNEILDPRSIAADFVIHASRVSLANADVVARKILSDPFMLVAAPHLLATHGQPLDVHDLQALPGVGFGNKASSWRWSLRRGTERVAIPFKPRITTTQLSALLSAARRGLGVAEVPSALCADDIAAGTLLRVLPEWHSTPVDIYAIYPSGRTLTRAARSFLETIERRLPMLAPGGR